MHRSPRVVIAWLVALVVTIATARVVASDISALHARAHRLGRDVRVVIAARDLPLGVTITVDALRVVSRPASTVPPDTEHDARVLTGRVVVVPRIRNDVVRASNLAPVARTGLDGVVPAGRRAVHVVVKDGFRPPIGSVVDALAAFDPSVGTAARTIARGALVLAVDDASGGGAGAGSALTLLVSEREALDVAYADANGAVTVALAPPENACCDARDTP